MEMEGQNMKDSARSGSLGVMFRRLRGFVVYGLLPFCAVSALAVFIVSCEELDNDIGRHGGGDGNDSVPVSLGEVAMLLSEIPIGKGQLQEVHDAVSSSSENGYDEEYTMRDLFRLPGAGVGDDRLPEGTKSAVIYDRPLRELIREHLNSAAATRSDGASGYGDGMTPEEFIGALESSDVQIYWPFSENWDGEELPVITFDPLDGAETNVGYRLVEDEDGGLKVEEVTVDEKMAQEETVWVVNRNDDSGYTSLELLRREDPEWGVGGGSVIIKSVPAISAAASGAYASEAAASGAAGIGAPATEVPMKATTASSGVKTLILREFTMLRNYDSWFAGASEFFVKMGAVENFTASTEAELRLYTPTVTDFMIVVKRKNVGVPQPFNAVLVSDWTEQLDQCALMITEDDGGTLTAWKCTALVRVASKSYGVEISIPINSRDDIVWRGQLSSRFIMANDNVTGHFGDVDLKFEVVDHL